MTDQLTLWPETPKSNLWENVDRETRILVINILARLIDKAVYPESLTDAEEKRHES